MLYNTEKSGISLSIWAWGGMCLCIRSMVYNNEGSLCHVEKVLSMHSLLYITQGSAQITIRALL